MADKAVAIKKTETPPADQGPGWPALSELHRRVDELFADFGRGFRSWPRLDWTPSLLGEGTFLRTMPAVDIAETDKGYEVSAELPGLDPEQIEVTVSGDLLSIRGEKTEEAEKKEASRYLSERRFGSFRRDLVLPPDADSAAIAARFDKGVLRVTMPKSATPKTLSKKVPISSK